MNVYLLLLALGIGTATGVVSSLLSEKAIRASERRRYRRQVLGEGDD